MFTLKFSSASTSGFTLIELVLVIVILGILSIYPMMKSVPITELTLPSQAQKLASDIRHAQVLAATWGKHLQLTMTSGLNGANAKYSLSCVIVENSPPCNVTPVIDPTTGSSFNVKLQKRVAGIGTEILNLNSMGQPTNVSAVNFSLCFPDCGITTNPSKKTITVQALTGFVTVSP